MVNKKSHQYNRGRYTAVAIATSAVIMNDVKGGFLLGLNNDPFEINSKCFLIFLIYFMRPIIFEIIRPYFIYLYILRLMKIRID